MKSVAGRLARRILRAKPPAVRVIARDLAPSVLFSVDDDPQSPSRRLLDLVFDAAHILTVGPRDGVTEVRIIANFRRLSFRRDPVLVFDDIRSMTMLMFWRKLALPNMDITSFGHWSGTGIAEWLP